MFLYQAFLLNVQYNVQYIKTHWRISVLKQIKWVWNCSRCIYISISSIMTLHWWIQLKKCNFIQLHLLIQLKHYFALDISLKIVYLNVLTCSLHKNYNPPLFEEKDQSHRLSIYIYWHSWEWDMRYFEAISTSSNSNIVNK